MEWLDHLPHNWPGVTALTVFVAYMMWRDRRADQKITEVHRQTKNKHKTNLRDDVDKSIGLGESAAASSAVTVRMLADFRDEFRAGFRRIERDIGGIREEMRTERIERIEGDRRH